MTPRFTVVMPVLNGERHIGAALASVLPQLAPDDEVLVVDNGSTDQTLAVVEATADPRIRILHAAARGPSAARNVGLAAAQGEFIAFLDHDDLWPKDRLAGLAAALVASPEAHAAVGRLTMRFDAGPDPRFANLDNSNSDMLVLGNVLFRRTALGRTAPMDETMRYGEDSDYLIRLRQAGLKVVQTEVHALIYRRHETNMTNNQREAKAGSLTALRRNIARQRSEPFG